MEFCDRAILVAVALLSLFTALVRAEDSPAASTFYLSDTETQFSLNIADDTPTSTDVYIYFTSPAYSWVGVGFGKSMKDSLMFILYPSQDGNNVTVSPRLADGNSEPSPFENTQLEILPGTTVTDEMFFVKAVCRSCRAWPGGFLNTKERAYPMIYAFGPGNRIQSDSLNAPLKRHFKYGHFTMDMVAATGKGGVPAPRTELKGVELQGDMTRDHDRANLAHAVMGCLAIFLFWPINVVVAGFFKKIKIHIVISVFTMVFLVISYGLGIATSGEYNRSKSFTSAHQILAFLSILPILLLSLLPLKPLSQLHASIPRLHTPLTTLTLTLLIITGGLGLHLASQANPVILGYSAVALLVAVFSVLLTTCIKRRGSAYARANGRKQLKAEDEQDLVLAAYYATKQYETEAGGDSRSVSAASSVPTLNSKASYNSYSNSNPTSHSTLHLSANSSYHGSVGGAGMGNANGFVKYNGGTINGIGAAAAGAHGRSPSKEGVFGGGTMPGPQYLLNMHPGVPVYHGTP